MKKILTIGGIILAAIILLSSPFVFASGNDNVDSRSNDRYGNMIGERQEDGREFNNNNSRMNNMSRRGGSCCYNR